MTKLLFSIISSYNSLFGKVILFLLLVAPCYGQYQIQYDIDITNLDFDYPLDTSFEDSVKLVLSVNNTINTLRKRGYISAELDTLLWNNKVATPHIFLGNEYKISQIKYSENERVFLEKFNHKESQILSNHYNSDDMNEWLTSIIDHLKNNGYPFAKISFDSIIINDNKILGSLHIERNQLILFDSIRIVGKPVVSENYLRYFTEIKAGNPYDESKVLEIGKKIGDVRFMKIRSTPTVSFIVDKAYVNIDLLPLNASRFDFLIGVLPRTGVEQGVDIIYDGTIEMINKLKFGEKFLFSIKALQPGTTELLIKFNYPYVLKMPFGLDIDFSIYKNAEEYIDLNSQLGWQYILSSDNLISAYWKYNSSRLLSVDSTAIANSGRLPNQLDVKFNGFGLIWDYTNLDYQFNPRKGIRFVNDANVGFKSIIKNLKIEEITGNGIDFSNAYDTLNTQSFQMNMTGELDFYIPIGKRSTMKIGMSGGIIYSEQKTFQNELFKLGGARSIRGFDEQSILADYYTIGTTEYRFLIAKNSFLFGFLDYGITHNPYLVQTWDTEIGLGGGLSFETKVGIFAISTAAGKDRNNDFNVQNAKVHFGFLSLF